jgi:hypothetical protein
MELKFKKLKGSKKGLMLTLVTIVIVILMLSEVLTYIYTSIEFDTITALGGPSSATATLFSTINNGYSSTLASGISWSISTLYNYERYSSLYKTNQFAAPPNGSTSSALASILYNGTLLAGKSYVSVATPPFTSGNLSIQNYTLKMERYATTLGLEMNVTNSSVLVYQTSPTTISASYRAFVNINSSYGTVSYPVSANATINISGLPDPYAQLTGFNGTSISVSNSVATGTGISYGSLSQYLFAKYPIFYTSYGTCSQIIQVLGASVSNYIIADSYAESLNSLSCGAAGLITQYPNATGVLTPYDVIPSSISLQQFSSQYGSLLILGGSSNATNLSGLESAIPNYGYVPSDYAPSYLSLLNGSFSQASPYGVTPLGSLNREVASFSGNNEIIITGINSISTALGGYNTVSFWMRWPATSPTGVVPFSFYSGTTSYDLYIAGGTIGFSNGPTDILAANLNPYAPQSHEWINIVAVFYNANNPAPPQSAIYIDGVQQQLFTTSGYSGVGLSSATNSIEIGGSPTSGFGSFSGDIANLQIYNTSLSPYQAEQLYLEGINGYPIQHANLSEWMPLNGNGNSYAFDGGTTSYSGTGPFFGPISDYPGSAISAGSFYSGQTGIVQGFGDCRSPDFCNYNSSELIYLPVNNATAPSAQSLGLSPSILPDSMLFSYGSNTIIVANDIPLNSIQGGYDTISFWMTWDGGAIETDSTPIYFNNFGLSGSLGCFGFSSGQPGSINIIGAPLYYYSNRSVNIIAELYNGQISSSNDIMYVDGTPATLSCNPAIASQPTITTPGTSMSIGGNAYSAMAFDGAISDVQVYNTLLTSNQIGNLYENNSVPGLSPTGYWPLSYPYNGLFNQTQDLASPSGTGIMWSDGTLCTNSNVIDSNIFGTCQATLVPNYILGKTYTIIKPK